MLLSLLSRESMTRLSVSWQKGHFMAGIENEKACIGYPLAGCSKRSQMRGARKIDERRRTWPVRCSEAIERNEAYESFSAAC
jgi:hypothetical protein